MNLDAIGCLRFGGASTSIHSEDVSSTLHHKRKSRMTRSPPQISDITYMYHKLMIGILKKQQKRQQKTTTKTTTTNTNTHTNKLHI